MIFFVGEVAGAAEIRANFHRPAPLLMFQTSFDKILNLRGAYSLPLSDKPIHDLKLFLNHIDY